MLSILSNLGFTQEIALHYVLILLVSPHFSLTNDRIRVIKTNVPLSITPAGLGSLLSESGPMYVVSPYHFTRDNLLIITESWV